MTKTRHMTKRPSTAQGRAIPNVSRLSGRLRGFMSSVLSVAIVATSVGSASAESFFFRYKSPISLSSNVPNPGEAPISVGNDITIFFAGVVGRNFSKSIPVRTKDVVQWKVVSGSIQSGLALDAETGRISGVAEASPTPPRAVLKGFDVSGRLIARADISFRFHEVAGDRKDFSFYGHVGKYMYRQIPSAVPVDHWEALTDLPADFRTDGSFLAGTPSKEYSTDVAFVGYDYMGEEVSFAYGDLLVEDGLQIVKIDDQIRRPDESFDVKPSAARSIGALDWRLVALDGKPSTLKLDAQTGAISGTIPTFDTSLRFQVEARDVDGVLGTSNIFTLSTSSPEVEVTNARNLTGIVATPYHVRFKASDLTGDTVWQIKAGSLPDGITLDAAKGTLAGTPTRVGEWPGLVVSVSTSQGGYAETAPFTFTVDAAPLAVSFAPLDVRVGTPFATTGPSLGEGIVAPYSFALVDPSTVDPSITVDTESATVSGTATAAGSLSVPFIFKNGDGKEKPVMQVITAYDPLSLSYDDVIAYRRVPATAFPAIDPESIVAKAAFSLVGDALPEGLALDPRSGVISGTVTTMDGASDIKVKLADDSGESVVSKAFNVIVHDRPDVVAEGHPVTLQRFVSNNERAATAQNVFDGVSFSLTSGTLPDGLTLDYDGVIRGTTTALPGTYDGLRVTAIDGEGYSAESEPFSVALSAPADLAPIPEASLKARWTQGKPFLLPLPAPSNAWGSVDYDILGTAAGTYIIDGKLSGTIDELGVHEFHLTMTDQAGRVLSATYSLEILPEMTAELDGYGLTRSDEDPDDITFRVPRGYDLAISSITENAIEPLSYALSGNVPAGITYSSGSLTGKPRTEGETARFTLTVTDATGTVVPLAADIEVLPRQAIQLSYDPVSPAGFVGLPISPVRPITKNAVGPVVYTVEGALPDGLAMDPTTGIFYGTPTRDGRFPGITVTATDAEGDKFAGTFGSFEVGIALSGSAELPATTFFTVRAGEVFDRPIKAANATAPIVYATASGQPLPYGVQLDNFTGKIYGMLTDPGQYPMGVVTALDTFDRRATTELSITAVGPLAISAPATDPLHQWSPVSFKVPTANAIGTTTYEIVGGSLPQGLTLNPKTGYIAGTPTVMGTSAGIVVRVTDSTASTAQTAPFQIVVTDRLPLTLNAQTSYTVVANNDYKLVMPVSNGVGALRFVQSGKLPDGITFNATAGAFRGTATSLGTYPGIIVTVTDSVGGTATATFSMVSEVNGPIQLFLRDTVTRVGQQISGGTVLVRNSIGKLSFSEDGSLAEHGLTLDAATGTFTGLASDLMDFIPNINVSDTTTRTTSGAMTVKVVPALSINAPERIEVMVNKAINPPITVSAVNSTSEVLEWFFEGTLPSGMQFSKANARFSGTPKQFGTFPVNIGVHEIEGLTTWAWKKVEIVVVSDGKVPTVSVSPLAAGYDVSAVTSVTPKYGNAKSGDVLSLAPGSAPLPPGMTIAKNSSGVWVLKKSAVDAAASGVYPGIKVRVTDGFGVFGDSEPFTIIYKTPIVFPAVTFETRALVPVKIAAPSPTAGRALGTLSYLFLRDSTKGSLSINPETGEITGAVSASGSNTVKVIDKVNGTAVRSVTYAVSFTASQVDVAIASDLVSYTDMAFPTRTPGYVPKVTNGLDGSTLSLNGTLPAGMSFVPADGTLVGTPTVAGDYQLELVYRDPYLTLARPFKLHIEKSDPDGYKFTRITWIKINQAYLHIWNYAVRSQGGHNLMHIVSIGEGTVSDSVKTGLSATGHVAPDVAAGQYATYNFPVGIPKGAVTMTAHGGPGSTYLVSVSKDGNTWVDLATQTVGNPHVKYSYSFEAIPTRFAFNGAQMAAPSKRAAYSFDLSALIEDASLSSVKKSDLSWTWAVDPDRAAGTMATLPAGLSLSGSKVAGTPVNSGTYGILLTASYQGKQVQKRFTLTIGLQQSSLSLAAMTLPTVVSSTPLSYDLRSLLTATNVPASSVKWSSADGVAGSGETAGLPNGLSLSEQGVLSGTSSASGTFVFNVTATFEDANAVAERVTATATYRISANPVAVPITSMMLTGDRHTCAVKTNGSVYCFGSGGSGRLGLGDTTNRLVPTAVPALSSGVAAIAPGGIQTCALKTDGSVLCFGNGVTTPTKVNALPPSTKIAAFGDRICAITADGGLYCWAGTGTPQKVAGMETGVVNVGTGYAYQCAVKSDGTLWCWSGNGVPAKIAGISDVKQVAAGWAHTCAVVSNGSVYCWGTNNHGQIGDNTTATRSAPTKASGISDAVQVSVGYDFTCAVRSNGGVMCWGFGENGKLGNNSYSDKLVPTQVTNMTSGAKSVWVGGAQACVLKTDESRFCWGRSSGGELGNGATSDKAIPTAVNGF
ncbi:hypothetical protein G6L37_06945 [Agrobacterium rubi]|nr:hypothetical protein [Agrobacterium rubi]NTF25102.1 hypothetical protein [Agrobacterium rubi]